MSPSEDSSDSSNPLPPLVPIRPRSPPLSEILSLQQQVLNSSSSISERFNISVNQPQNNVPPLRQPPHHIWFSGGGWAMSGAGAELGLLPSTANLNYRIQCWNFSKFELPNLKDAQSNLVVAKCRIHNDASVDISADGNILAALVPANSSNSSTPSVNLSVYSLEKSTFAQCLYVWTFSSSAISVSLSPLSRYVVVGLTTPRSTNLYSYPPTNESATVAQVLKLSGHKNNKTPCFEHVRNIDINRGDDLFSLNSIRFLPDAVGGLIYGDNRGRLIVLRPTNSNESGSTVSKNLPNLVRASNTTGTQTVASSPLGRTLSIGTQTIETAVMEPAGDWT
jgi:hypothetical protein